MPHGKETTEKICLYHIDTCRRSYGSDRCGCSIWNRRKAQWTRHIRDRTSIEGLRALQVLGTRCWQPAHIEFFRICYHLLFLLVVQAHELKIFQKQLLTGTGSWKWACWSSTFVWPLYESTGGLSTASWHSWVHISPWQSLYDSVLPINPKYLDPIVWCVSGHDFSVSPDLK